MLVHRLFTNTGEPRFPTNVFARLWCNLPSWNCSVAFATDNNYKVFATANTMIDAADCDTTFCTLKFPCFSPTSRHYITMIREIKAAYELLQSIWQTVRDSGAWNLPKTFIGGHCKCYWQNDRWEERCRRMVVRPMNKFQIENPETSYKDDCWTLFMGRRPPGDLKLAPAVAEGYESGGRYEC